MNVRPVGYFRPGNSWLHRRHPVTKLLGLIATTVAAFLLPGWALPALAAAVVLIALSSGPLQLGEVRKWLDDEGRRLVLTEGGPSLMAELVRDRVLDELFVTTSPTLFGRFRNDGRKSLTNGLDLGGVPLELMSLRRHGSYLFSRYAVGA